ncbi:hypothetical protein EGY07_08630 [Chryseobacterium indologenes]|uniref:Uncharacterized protein n=1 Tax=Chryseobacterium indologenes TaxID=253 RepID=A0AAD0YTR0_CHRID|nr:hypothetical protein EGX91_15565 [Chryseobacterium indologenes]AYZ35632.1 hypothetical protein EGY07_08630 [Chryseobacterium indologenes]AZB16968.1 hypothetical protein EG352_03865 [Chryseobacterium indologenes]HAO29615.1 hypothetical protein [Chryseobacterium indologenes]
MYIIGGSIMNIKNSTICVFVGNRQKTVIICSNSK